MKQQCLVLATIVNTTEIERPLKPTRNKPYNPKRLDSETNINFNLVFTTRCPIKCNWKLSKTIRRRFNENIVSRRQDAFTYLLILPLYAHIIHTLTHTHRESSMAINSWSTHLAKSYGSINH